jgi:CcmD family protein
MQNLNSLIAAYAAAWLIFFGYHYTVARRLSQLREEVEKLKQSIGKRSR